MGYSVGGGYQTVMVKIELSHKAKLLIHWSIYTPTLSFGHELWLMNKSTRSQKQVAEGEKGEKLSHSGRAQSTAAVPSHREKSSASGISHREGAPRQTQDTLNRLCLSAGLGVPHNTP